MSATVTTRVASVQAFFDDLASRPNEPLLHQVTGTLEWNIEGAGRWWVSVKRGAIQVSQSPHQADCIMSCSAQTFLAIVSGETNPVAAVLRGAVVISGDPGLGLNFERLLR